MLCIDANIIAFLQSRHKEKSGEKKLIPLTVSVSPAVWDVLETEENIINEAVTKIDIPEFSGEVGLMIF
ncbi:hypothetical protein OESDEN_19893 [Oesophagostomum dentatum]|uniref:Uncharacterized protein n=1 Tax=Oesophagostomum dentatum TaxID=61180 RepID=A0A0B1SA61_OESDE|nr:hypothetical protein OESDEN_19893 [Oesophagostomum dentatum]